MTAPTPRRRKFPTSLNGGEMQDPDDIRVGETHVMAPEGFERGTARDVDATDTEPDPQPDSALDVGVHADERAEQGDEDADARARSASDAASPRTRETGRAPNDGDHGR